MQELIMILYHSTDEFNEDAINWLNDGYHYVRHSVALSNHAADAIYVVWGRYENVITNDKVVYCDRCNGTPVKYTALDKYQVCEECAVTHYEELLEQFIVEPISYFGVKKNYVHLHLKQTIAKSVVHIFSTENVSKLDNLKHAYHWCINNIDLS